MKKELIDRVEKDKMTITGDFCNIIYFKLPVDPKLPKEKDGFFCYEDYCLLYCGDTRKKNILTKLLGEDFDRKLAKESHYIAIPIDDYRLPEIKDAFKTGKIQKGNVA